MKKDSKKDLIESTTIHLTKMIIDHIRSQADLHIDEWTQQECSTYIITSMHALVFELTCQTVKIQSKLTEDSDMENSKKLIRESMKMTAEYIEKMRL